MSQTQQIVLETPASITELSQPAVSHLEETAASEQTPQTFDAVSPTVPEKGRRLAIIILIVSSNMVQMISNMVGLAAGLEISKELGVSVGPGNANWAAASYPLTQGTFVLISGRLGAVYGHRTVLIGGAIWFVIWTLANGFCNNFVSFNVARAFSGIGGALIMPNAVALISSTIPPGKVRNITLGFFGASAPIGSYLGAIWAGIFVQYVKWNWIFFSLAILGVITFGILGILLPRDHPVDRNGKVDWIGATLGTGGLIAFNVAWNQAPASGWKEPFEIALLVVSMVLIAAFVIWQSKFAETPIMPLDIWMAPSFAALTLVVLLSFMSNGIFLWYMVAWLQILRDKTILQFGVEWTPFGIVATIGTFISAWLIRRLAAQWILAIGSASILIANVLLATMPAQQTYWAQVFPATIFMAFCPDFVYVAAQIVTSNSVKRKEQGVAASLIGVLNLYGNSLGLGFAGTIETEVNKHRPDPILGYRAALSFGGGIALIAVVLASLFVRVAKDEREGWTDPADRDEDFGISLSGGTSTAIDYGSRT
ncbi:efflux pump antibiotic resistance protein, putative [Paecilomyces variotii No. 5]|uniref:Efflux pump antibiotic resistance protein, putative n=1 Tax=Byssochlamys spectabilis (strain No. 5 / NBRC 109023) TaxID=1356009 RepID=V5FZN9_BYSSN|nr:efflux pump antibiotic resistance protein, putative [Paecilomyces variotii No. 5]